MKFIDIHKALPNLMQDVLLLYRRYNGSLAVDIANYSGHGMFQTYLRPIAWMPLTGIMEECNNVCDVNVRALTAEDMPELERVSSENTGWVGVSVCDLVRDIMMDKPDDQDFIYGAFAGDKLVGYCTVGYADGLVDVVDTPDDGYLSDVYVDPAYRGQQIGSIMVTTAVYLKCSNHSCWLHAIDDNAVHFYERIGFSKVADDDSGLMKRFVY